MKKWLVGILLGLCVAASAQTIHTGSLELANVWTNNNIFQGGLTLQQVAAATAGANQNSPSLQYQANYWNGSASAVDQWSVQDVLGSGTNPTATLTFSHSGSPGTLLASFPGYLAPGSTNFAGLATVGNSNIIYCTDCVQQTPCSGSGTGAMAFRVNGQWQCSAGTGGGGTSINSYTVATLPASPLTGTYATVTDGAGLSCTTGGGSTLVLCRYSGSAWQPESAGVSPPAGDLGGTIASPTVVKLQTIALSATAPTTSTPYMWYSGSQWQPASAATAGLVILAPTANQTITPGDTTHVPLTLQQAASASSQDIFDVNNNTPTTVFKITNTGNVVATGSITDASGAVISTSGGVAQAIPMYSTATLLVPSSLTDNGTVVNTTEALQTGDGSHAGLAGLLGNAALPTLPAGQAGFLGPNGAVTTPWWLQLPVSGPGGAAVMAAGAPSSNISQLTFYSILPNILGGTGVNNLTFSGNTAIALTTTNAGITQNARLVGDSNGNAISGPNVYQLKHITAAGYTMVAGDCGAHFLLDNGTAQTFTLPASYPALMCEVYVENIGAGTWTISRNGLNIDEGTVNPQLTTSQGIVITTDGSTTYATMRGLGSGGGGGGSVSVNGTTVTSPNFGNLPAAQTNNLLGVWQSSGSNVSVEIPITGTGTTVASTTGSFIAGNAVITDGNHNFKDAGAAPATGYKFECSALPALSRTNTVTTVQALGNCTFPGSDAANGQIVRVRAWGNYTTVTAPPNFTMNVYQGGSGTTNFTGGNQVCSGNVITPNSNKTGVSWWMECTIFVTGAPSTTTAFQSEMTTQLFGVNPNPTFFNSSFDDQSNPVTLTVTITFSNTTNAATVVHNEMTIERLN